MSKEVLNEMRGGAHPERYYSYQQALASLDMRLGTTDGEIAMWLDLGATNGGIDAYLHVHEFAEPPQATLDNLLLHPCEPDPSKPPYIKALVGMYFKKDEIERFNPEKRYISYGALYLRWKYKNYIKDETEFTAKISSVIHGSCLHDCVPGYGFSSLGAGSENVPPEWAMFDKNETCDIEAKEFTQKIGENLIGWYDATLDASLYFGRRQVTVKEAATLLCRQNPLDDSSDPLLISTDETNPLDFKRLLRVFEEVAELDAKPRTLMQWLDIAKRNCLKYHSWIDAYVAAVEEASGAKELTRVQLSTVGDSSQPIACHSACTKQEIIDGFNLDGKKWDEILSRPGSDGKRFKDALVQSGKRGRGKNGKSNSALWNPVVFARLLIQHEDMNQGQVVARFKKAWPKLENEMMVEIGDIER